VGTTAHPPARQASEQSSVVLTFRTLGRRRSLDGVPSYLVETFLPRGTAAARAAYERRARSAAQTLTQEGTSVRLDRAFHVPEDEICFFVFSAPSSRDAALAAQLAGLGSPRVVEVISSGNADKEEQR
jgi:hypothetical protein